MKILIVLVLYRMHLDESPTYQSLLNADGCFPDGIDLFVYDNTESKSNEKRDHDCSYHYIHDPLNGGLAAAYNSGLEHALYAGYDWMLLLDQDTDLPKGFLLRLREAIAEVSVDGRVVAVIPKIYSNNKLISPMKVGAGWALSEFDHDFHGLIECPVTAINSGAVLRVSFLKELGGFDRRYKLDYLDHWLFRKIQNASRGVYVSNEVLHHDFSMHDFKNKVSILRYASMLSGQHYFFHERGSIKERFTYMKRLLGDALRLFKHKETRIHAKMAVKQFGVEVMTLLLRRP